VHACAMCWKTVNARDFGNAVHLGQRNEADREFKVEVAGKGGSYFGRR